MACGREGGGLYPSVPSDYTGVTETALTLSAFFFLLIHRARVIPDEADLEDLAAPKRKRSDDNWRTARSVQSALKRESAALEKLARSQAQAKMIGHELYKSNKTHRQVVLQAEEEMGNLHERHREDIADLHQRHREDVAALHDLEECLADSKQEPAQMQWLQLGS